MDIIQKLSRNQIKAKSYSSHSTINNAKGYSKTMWNHVTKLNFQNNNRVGFSVLKWMNNLTAHLVKCQIHLYVECKNQRYRVPRRDTADQIMMPAQMSNQVEKSRPQRGI